MSFVYSEEPSLTGFYSEDSGATGGILALLSGKLEAY